MTMKQKKSVYLLLAGIMLCSLVSTGCGNQSAEDNYSVITPSILGGSSDAETKELSWSFTHTALNGQYDAAFKMGSEIYGCSYTKDGAIVEVQNLQTNGNNKTYLIPGATGIQKIETDPQNNLCLLGRAETGNSLWQITPAGEINTISNITLENAGDYPVLKDFAADQDGHYYLLYETELPMSELYEDNGEVILEIGGKPIYMRANRLYVKDRNMNTICYETAPAESYVNQVIFLFDEDGNPTLLFQDRNGSYKQRVRTEAEAAAYNPESLGQFDLPSVNSGVRPVATQNGLLYIKNGALHLFDLTDGTDEKLLELAEGGIYEEDIIYLGTGIEVETGGETIETIEIIDNYKGNGQTEYTKVEWGINSQVTVTLGVMSLEQELQKFITTFNRYQNEAKIVPVIYAGDYDYDAGYAKLKLDVLQGKAPDLISTSGIDYEVLARAGAFTDLYEFMDKDPECGRSTFLQSVLKAYEMNGHFYTASCNFRLCSMWGGSSVVQGKYGVNMDTLIRILNANGGDINNIIGVSAVDEGKLTNLCSAGMDEFIDWDTGICDFTGEAFRQTLEFVKNYKGVRSGSLYTGIREKKFLLKIGIISSVEDYLLEKELFGEDVEFIGLPTAKGSGSAVYMGNMLALNAQSGHPDAAWQFLRYYMLNGYGISGTGFPLVTEQFEKVLADSMEYLTVEENGHTEKMMRKYYVEPNIIEISIYKAEKKDIDTIREAVERADRKYEYNIAIQNIIDEEAESYFKDQKSLDAVTEIIQNRVQLYLDEQK